MKPSEVEEFIVEVISDDEVVQSLCERYWATDADGNYVETVSAICNDLGLTQSKLTKLVTAHSYVYYESHACPSCWVPMHFKSRAALLNKPNAAKTCDECLAVEAAQEAELKMSMLIGSEKRALSQELQLQDLELEHIAYLLALVRFSGSEDLSEIGEYGLVRSGMLSPSKEFDIEILRTLYSQQVVYVSPTSTLAAITVADSSGKYSFNLEYVRWKIALQNGLSAYANIYSCLEDTLKERVREFGAASLRELCDRLALEECLAYLNLTLTEHRLGYNFGDKTRVVMNKALEGFPVAEVYSFILRAAKDAAAFYQRGAGSKDHASKTVPGSIERQCERALANGWQVTSFNRNYNLPQSALSRVVYNSLFGTDDGGFKLKNNALFERLDSDYRA